MSKTGLTKLNGQVLKFLFSVDEFKRVGTIIARVQSE